MDHSCEPVIAAKVRPRRVEALARPRLAALLDRAWRVPITLLVAPSGSGKTTAISQFVEAARETGRPVAWYQAEASDADEQQLVRHLDAAFALSSGTPRVGWSTVESAAVSLESDASGERALVIDDLHALEGSQAEKSLERLASYMPSAVHLILAGRRPPSFNLPRLRLQGQLNEIGPDDLRFRSWEADDLFRHHFAEPLRSDELTELLRRTDGWAAGLKMFRMATTGKSLTQRHEALTTLSGRIVEFREYLDRNLLEGLDDELRSFLVRASVLGRVTPAWCDELLESGASDRLLDEVERRHGILARDRGRSTLRFSKVLQDRLGDLLAEELSDADIRDFYGRAGPILEAGSALPEALRAYCRAHDWRSAHRLLQNSGADIFDGRSGQNWLPPALPEIDAWTALAKARHELTSGSWLEAVETYEVAERSFRQLSSTETCRRERTALESWLTPDQPHPTDWLGDLRRVLGLVEPEPPFPAVSAAPKDLLVGGVAAIVRGRLRAGIPLLDAASASGRASTVIAGYASLISTVARLLLGEADAQEVTGAADAVEHTGPPWLPRLVLALGSESGYSVSDGIGSARALVEEDSNPWMTAGLTMLHGVILLTRGEAMGAFPVLEDARIQFESLGAAMLAVWACAFSALALAMTDRNSGFMTATSAARAAAASGCPGALAASLRIMNAIKADAAEASRVALLEADGIIGIGGLVDRLLGSPGSIQEAGHPARGPAELAVDLRCLGGFSLLINGRAVDSLRVRPRARAVLFILALHAGEMVHRDLLLSRLWPLDFEVGLRNLQVALSSLRRLLETASADRSVAILRQGDSYYLDMTRQQSDISEFEEACRAGRRHARSGAHQKASHCLHRALDLYRGDLLPEAGTAEWVLEPREQYRLMAARAAEDLARSCLAMEDPVAAVETCRRGLQLDRYSDELWRMLIDSHERAADHLSAGQARLGYEKALTDLNLVTRGTP